MGVFDKHQMYIRKEGKIVEVNTEAFNNPNEAFELLKSLYDTHYGNIEENGNLVAIHTGGWSDNEELISEFTGTAWWFKYHRITSRGGHYFFNIDSDKEKDWVVVAR